MAELPKNLRELIMAGGVEALVRAAGGPPYGKSASAGSRCWSAGRRAVSPRTRASSISSAFGATSPTSAVSLASSRTSPRYERRPASARAGTDNGPGLRINFNKFKQQIDIMRQIHHCGRTIEGGKPCASTRWPRRLPPTSWPSGRP
jgi:hypothetical protein